MRQLFQFLTELGLGRCAHNLINKLPTLKKKQRGHTPYPVMTGSTRMQGGVEDGDLDPAQIFTAETMHQRGQGLAGAAGGGVKINHHRQ